jgi:hypothetical protein
MPKPTVTTSAQSEPEQTAFRDERFAAARLGVSVETMRTWRKQNRGPRFRRLERCVRYRISDLEAFVDTAPAGGGHSGVSV